MKRDEVLALRLQEKTLPGWLRGRGLLVLTTDWVPGWDGPEPAGWVHLHAQSFHFGLTLDSPGVTVWFYARPGTENPFTPERWEEGAGYILARLGRRSHTPSESYTCYLMPAAPPGLN
jgi:hypothetical protein